MIYALYTSYQEVLNVKLEMKGHAGITAFETLMRPSISNLKYSTVQTNELRFLLLL